MWSNKEADFFPEINKSFTFPGMGLLHPNLKLACFVCYLKIINTLLKNNVCMILKLSKENKYGIDILVGHAFFKLKIKTVKVMIRLITQELLGLLTLYAILGFLGQFTILKLHNIIFQKKC